MSERAIEENVCAWLQFQGFGTVKCGLEGYPDRLILCGSGRHVWVEFKTPSGKLRPQQINRIAKLHEIGEVVHVVTSLEEAQSIFAPGNFPTSVSMVRDSKNRGL